MNHPQLLSQFVQKHQLNTTFLPDRTRYWHLSSAQIADLKLTMDEQFTRTAHPDFPREVQIWEKGPVLYEGLFGAGIVFCNLEEAEPLLQKIRPLGFSEEEWYVHFAFEREDVIQILSQLGFTLLPRPFTKAAQPAKALEKPYGYLIEGPGLWFATEEDFRRYDAFVEEIMQLL